MEEQHFEPGEFESRHLQSMTSTDLVRHILAEVKLFVRAEVLHARAELRDEVAAAKTSGIMLGAGGALVLMGLSVLLVALALALPMREGLAALIVGAIVLIAGAICAFLGYRRVPRKPMPHTQDRMKHDFQVTRERLS